MSSSTSADYTSTSNPNSTVPGNIDSFQTTGPGFAGDRSQDFAGATGGSDRFSEKPNSKSLEEVIDGRDKEESGGGIKGTVQKIKAKLGGSSGTSS